MEVEHDQVVFKERLGRKAAVTQLLPQRQLMQLLLSHQTRLPAVATIIHRKLKMISRLVHLEPLDILRNVLLLVLVLLVQLELGNHIQELKHLPLVNHTLALKPQPLALLIQQQVKHNDQLGQVALHRDQLQLEYSQDFLVQLNKDPPLVVSDLEVEVVAELLHQVNKMKVKKATTQLFPVNQTLIIQSTLKFRKHLSIVTSRSSQAIMLTLKPAAKSSTSAL